MPKLVVAGAVMQCTFGVAPAVLIVTPENKTLGGGPPAATIMDHVPIKNIPTFAMCSSLANPTVASATTAALGVLTPMPCVPATSSPWFPGAVKTLVGNQPALNDACKCMCNWAGMISITFPGQLTADVA